MNQHSLLETLININDEVDMATAVLLDGVRQFFPHTPADELNHYCDLQRRALVAMDLLLDVQTPGGLHLEFLPTGVPGMSRWTPPTVPRALPDGVFRMTSSRYKPRADWNDKPSMPMTPWAPLTTLGRYRYAMAQAIAPRPSSANPVPPPVPPSAAVDASAPDASAPTPPEPPRPGGMRLPWDRRR